MMLKIGDFEIEIKARKTWHDRANEADTMAFLNELCCNMATLANYMTKDERKHMNAYAKYVRNDKNDIYAALDEAGYYDDIKCSVETALHD